MKFSLSIKLILVLLLDSMLRSQFSRALITAQLHANATPVNAPVLPAGSAPIVRVKSARTIVFLNWAMENAI